MKKIIPILLLLHILSIYSHAQTDREFWFAAPEVFQGDQNYDKPIVIRLTTLNAPANVTISIPANPAFNPITNNIPANSTTSVDLTAWIDQIENSPANTVLNKGILIQSDADVTAYYEVVSSYCLCNPEVFALKGKNAIGNEFYISSQSTFAIDTGRFSPATTSFDIVATQDNTIITITPAKDIVGHPANVPFNITLNRGQTYSAVAVYKSGNAHLQGSHVVSDKPIAVTLKDDLVRSDVCADLMGDQTIPVSVIGNEYIVTRGYLNNNDLIVIMAVEDNTSIYIDGSSTPSQVLSKSQSWTFNLTNNSSYIKADKKIYVYHITGNGCELGSALIPKLTCTGSRSVNIVRSSNNGFAVMISTKNGNQDFFTVNGNPSLITAANFSVVPGTGGTYVAARIDLSNAITTGTSVNISNSKGRFSLGFINGNEGTGCRVGFFSDFKSSNVQNNQIEICEKDSAQLNAFGGISYEWSPADGLNSSVISNPKASPDITTNYRVLITDEDGCVDSAFTNVIVNKCIPAIASFTAPDTVCINTPITINNTSTNATTNYWSFCTADINATPTGKNLGNTGNLALPVYIDYAYDNGNYYAILVNNYPGGLIRLNFGNSLLNTPTSTYLGNFGGAIPQSLQGIQVIKNEGKWYALIVGGEDHDGITSRILKAEFGATLANTPIITDWGNIGNLSYPHDLFLFKEANIWYGLTVNYNSNTITRFTFGSSFNNPPSGVNIGNIGNLSSPTGICPISDNGIWHVFVANYGSHSLSRIDFGNSLLSAPTNSINMGNIGNLLHNPRDIYIFNFCSQLVGFIVNDHTTENIISRLNFNDITSIPSITSIANTASLNFPHSISRIFRAGSDLHAFVPNTYENTLSRITFQGRCTSPTIPSSTLKDPPTISYSQPGTYNINLTVDEGLPTQSSFCKQVVVLPNPSIDFNFEQDLCNPLSVKFEGKITGQQSFVWDFGNGVTNNLNINPIVAFNNYDIYAIKLKATSQYGCSDSVFKQVPVQLLKDSIIITRDTTLCEEPNFTGIRLNALPALKYCWSPSIGLSGTDIANPVISNFIPATTYYLHAMATGPNLITNGNFSQGNTGFTSEYNYSINNTTEGQYNIGTNPITWNPYMINCRDHTSGNTNMMLVNGSPTLNTKVWSQTIPVKPNTNYAFSTWLEHITIANPAQLQFSINGTQLGQIFIANPQGCVWEQFYTVWNSGANTTATISIVNKNTIIQGNDFALDDISFAELKIIRDSVTIAINEKPNIDFNYTIPYCKSPHFNGFTINEPYPINTWQWNLGDNQTNYIQALSHSYTKGGSYNVKLLATDVNGCKDSTIKTIQLDTATAIATVSGAVCPGSTVTLQGSGGTQYEWTPTASVNNSTNQNTTALLNSNTKFYLKVTDAIGCEDTASVLASVIPKPPFTQPADMQTCKGNSIILNANANLSYQYTWGPADYLNDPNAASPVATPDMSIEYTVHITEPQCGYDTSFTIKTMVSANTNVFVLPNAFTPNGDGKNDCFGIRNWGNTVVREFLIYNRWGQKVFETKNPSNCWDGKYKGQPQNEGSYIYIIKALTPCGEVERKGTFMLVR